MNKDSKTISSYVWLRIRPEEMLNLERMTYEYGLTKSELIRRAIAAVAGFPELLEEDKKRDWENKPLTVEERVLMWMCDNPEGTIDECAAALGLDVQTILKIGLIDRDLSGFKTRQRRSSGRSSEEERKIKEWFDSHPYASPHDCAVALGLSYRKVYSIRQTENSLKGRVRLWQRNNPLGDITDCSDELHITLKTLCKYWEFTANDNPKIRRIVKWICKNPDGGIVACSTETNIPKEELRPFFMSTLGRKKNDVVTAKNRAAKTNTCDSEKSM